MQELLPFGEYVPPEHGGLPAAFLGFEAWDMDHLLQRLALQSGSHARRPRTRPRTRAQSLQGPPQGMISHAVHMQPVYLLQHRLGDTSRA